MSKWNMIVDVARCENCHKTYWYPNDSLAKQQFLERQQNEAERK